MVNGFEVLGIFFCCSKVLSKSANIFAVDTAMATVHFVEMLPPCKLSCTGITTEFNYTPFVLLIDINLLSESRRILNMLWF